MSCCGSLLVRSTLLSTSPLICGPRPSDASIAAVRRGTITTSQPLPPAILEQEFKPEDPYARDKQKQIRFLLVAAVFAAGGLV